MKSSKYNTQQYFTILALLLVLISGCTEATAPSAPLDINSIPVPPGSQILVGSYAGTLDMTYITTRRAFGVSNKGCEANTLYYLLDDAGSIVDQGNLDEHLNFYQTAFASTDWRPDKILDLPGVQRWKRTSTAGDQTLTLGVIPVERGDSFDYVLMMVLATGKACHP